MIHTHRHLCLRTVSVQLQVQQYAELNVVLTSSHALLAGFKWGGPATLKRVNKPNIMGGFYVQLFASFKFGFMAFGTDLNYR